MVTADTEAQKTTDTQGICREDLWLTSDSQPPCSASSGWSV